MFKEQMNKIKNLIFKNTNENGEGKIDKKKIENLVVFLIILIITLIAINTILKSDKNTEKDSGDSLYKELAKETVVSTSKNVSSDELENKIERILGTMSGVGKVNVLITYSQSSEVVAMYNENNSTSHTEETDSSGGSRTVEEENIKKEVIFTEEGRLKCSNGTNNR